MTAPTAKDHAINRVLGSQIDTIRNRRKNKDQFPNDITRLRGKLIKPQIGLLILGLLTGWWPLIVLSGLVFGFQYLSDGLDGYAARWYNNESAEGAVLDPHIDKQMIYTNLIVLDAWFFPAFRDGSKWSIMTWFVVILLTAVMGWQDKSSEDFYRAHPDVESNIWGKYKFMAQATLVFVTILGIASGLHDPEWLRFLGTMGIVMQLFAIFCAHQSLKLKRASV